MAKKYEKRALLTGAGSIYVDFMTTEETPTTPPVYANAPIETPSLNTIEVSLELSEKQTYLSNMLHDDLSNVKSATITLEAGYLPLTFEDEAQGKIKVGESYAMPTNPVKKPFRLAVPLTDSNGDEYIINFPKCTLSPVNISGATGGEEVNEKLKSFNVIGKPLIYRKAQNVFLTLDLAVSANKTKYDRDKLLEKGWYDETTLAECTVTAVP